MLADLLFTLLVYVMGIIVGLAIAKSDRWRDKVQDAIDAYDEATARLDETEPGNDEGSDDAD
jgi:hypothetical protein